MSALDSRSHIPLAACDARLFLELFSSPAGSRSIRCSKETKTKQHGKTHITTPLPTNLAPPQPPSWAFRFALTPGLPLIPPKPLIQHPSFGSGFLQLLPRDQRVGKEVERPRSVLFVGGGAAGGDQFGACAWAARDVGAEEGGEEGG